MIEVHSFRISDVEDPSLYVAEPLWNWQNSEKGQWVIKHAIEQPIWHYHIDNNSFYYQVVVKAKFNKIDELYYHLKWGNDE